MTRTLRDFLTSYLDASVKLNQNPRCNIKLISAFQGSTAVADEKVCKHDLCNCRVKGNDDYCSAYCEGAGEADITDLACECGHPGCIGDLH